MCRTRSAYAYSARGELTVCGVGVGQSWIVLVGSYAAQPQRPRTHDCLAPPPQRPAIREIGSHRTLKIELGRLAPVVGETHDKLPGRNSVGRVVQ